MELITKAELPVGQCEIKHSDTLMLMGSCFTDNIGNKLSDNKFRCDINPFGVLYNPMSIYVALSQLLENKSYGEDDVMQSRGVWFSLMHHSSFSSPDKSVCLDNINSRIGSSSEFLRRTDWLLLTFGTARVYKWNESGCIVGNCHKLNEKLFTRSLLDVEEIVNSYMELISRLRSVNPDIKIMFTVSPIRHAKDGMHGNQISKSVLLLAIDRICSANAGCYYFPSYEIMMDELRDYRFYSDDMLHPSSMAVEYIWERFSESYFNKDTLNIIKSWNEIRRALGHKPFNPESEAYRDFLSQILLKIETLKEKFTYLDVEKEIKLCRTLLKK
ncbi:GSCFA domain-containing protein [uncultured Bacteroides sp.]|uniref:GSCFA domain-containing protein n=1 Tax=uncultured Bacteroides sp. TaxID=162156 RepID=UPI00260C24D2|nr:GSCFA domain-containing protein [uncultured Bacteroides sp.]